NVLREELGELDSPALAATEARNAIGPLGNAIAILDRSGAPLAAQLDRVTLADLLPAAGQSSVRTIETASGKWRVHVEPQTLGAATFTLVVARPLTDIARRCRRSGSSWRTPRTSCERLSPSSAPRLT